MATLEHINLTVRDPKKTANLLVELFDWRVRWEGDSIHNGYTLHVGDQNSYLAIYGRNDKYDGELRTYDLVGGLNHVGIVVDDLDEVEKRVKAAGYSPHSHADYEPGRRFYFKDSDGLEFEVIDYS